MKDVLCRSYEGTPMKDIGVSRVIGQLIMCDGERTFIVVNTREVEEYFEDHRGIAVPHHKIGGFVEVHPASVRLWGDGVSVNLHAWDKRYKEID